MRRPLFVQADSRRLNPTLDQALIDEAYADDPESARAEWGGDFRSDITAYLSDDLIDIAIPAGVRALSREITFQYYGFTDPAGGAVGGDAFTLGIAHQMRGGRIVLDKILWIDPPFEPDTVCERYAEALSAFGLSTVVGDAYAGEWPTASYRKFGITYTKAGKSKSDIYSEMLPLFTSKRIELLDVQRLDTELRLLERTPRRGGRGDVIDHPPAAHDDCPNAALGACWLASSQAAVGPGDSHLLLRGQHHHSYDPYERGLGETDGDKYERGRNGSR